MYNASMKDKNDRSWTDERVSKLAAHLERINFSNYAELMDRPWKMLFLNFIFGVARGLGVAIGLTVAAAVVFIVLAKLLGPLMSIPVLGSFLAEIIKATQQYLPRQ